MRHYPSLDAYENSGLLGCMRKTLQYLKNGKQSNGGSDAHDSDGPHCEVWVITEYDDDESVAKVFGAPLTKLSFDRVSFNPDEERFTCHLPGGERLLIVADIYWLRDDWRDWLITQL